METQTTKEEKSFVGRSIESKGRTGQREEHEWRT